jgi:hypothetical protein
MKSTSLVFLVFLIVQGSTFAAQPNIVFFFSDDQAYDTLGCYGNPDVKTPNIDRLASQGIAFDRHYNTTAICMASRANVMTGLLEYKHGTNFGKGFCMGSAHFRPVGNINDINTSANDMLQTSAKFSKRGLQVGNRLGSLQIRIACTDDIANGICGCCA